MPRNKQFKIEDVLDKATEAFWRNGYRGTSLSQLTEATGLHKGSLYSTFESKEDLFLRCLQFYYQEKHKPPYDGKRIPSEYLQSYIDFFNDESEEELKKGCLIVNSWIESINVKEKVQKSVSELFEKMVDNLRSCFRDGKKSKCFPETLDEHEASLRFIAIVVALRTFCKLGRPATELRNLANWLLADFNLKISGT